MVFGTAATAISIALPILKLSYESIKKVNEACVKNLPLAFDITIPDEEGTVEEFEIKGNPDYRFEGFGLDVGIPLELSFWIHYKPDSPEHVEVGKMLVPIRLSEVLNLPKILP